MGQRELEKLVAEIKNELRREGQIIGMGRDYSLTVINLIFTGISGGYGTDDLYYARGDQDPIYPGEHEGVSLEAAADVVQELLKKIYDWSTMARQNEVESVDVTVARLVEVKRNLYGGRGQPVTPDDPMIMF